jgi:excisionase family DNA binding protein
MLLSDTARDRVILVRSCCDETQVTLSLTDSEFAVIARLADATCVTRRRLPPAEGHPLMGTPRLAYSTREAAAMLGISPEQVKRLVRGGKLRAVRSDPNPGGKFLITEESMREWLDGLEVA